MLRRLSLLALALFLTTSCARERAVPPSLPERPPIILISIDTLRSDHLPAYGYRGVTTPHIDALRRDSILFESAYSHSPLTLPSHLSMLTGLLPTEHGVRNNVGYTFDAAAHESLPVILRHAGYATGAAVSSFVLRSETGLGSLFDFYEDTLRLSSTDKIEQHQRPGDETEAVAEPWIAANAAQPLFFFFHIYEPHAPYTPPAEFRKKGRTPYDGEIATADAIVGRFLDSLKANGLYDRALVILTSDHGEGLMDHGEDEHGVFLYRETIQVPLIVKLPHAARSGTIVTDTVQLIDLVPTICEVLSIEPPAGLKGRSIFSDRSIRHVYSETYYPRIHLGWSELTSLLDGTRHYIEAPGPELYALRDDPGEKKNIIDEDRRAAASLREELAAMRVALQPPQRVDPEEARRLASLGYIGTPRNATGALPDPKEKIATLVEMHRAFRAADQRKYGVAVAALSRLLQENPGSIEIMDKLAQTLTDMGRYDDAIRVYQIALRQAPGYAVDAALGAASLLLKKGALDEAAEYARLVSESNPVFAHQFLARVAMARGEFAAAEAEARACIDERNPQPGSLLLLAEVQARKGDAAAALETVGVAESRASETHLLPLYRLEFVRADALARANRPAEAAAAYRKEIEQFPGDLQAYANLAVTMMVAGRERDAIGALELLTARNPRFEAFDLAARTYAAFEMKPRAAVMRKRAEKTAKE